MNAGRHLELVEEMIYTDFLIWKMLPVACRGESIEKDIFA